MPVGYKIVKERSYMALKRISFNIDEDLLKIVDRVRKIKYQNRSEFIKNCLLKSISVDEADKSF